MTKLWLDDNRDPNDIAIQVRFGSESGMVWVKTIEAAIRHLKTNQVEWLSFDHDLGTPATGYDLAKWIEQQAYLGHLRPFAWTVHSANPTGATNIRRAMENAEKYWQHHASSAE